MFKIYTYYYSIIVLMSQLFSFFIKIKFNKILLFSIFYLLIHILIFYKFKINNIKFRLFNLFLLCLLNCILNLLTTFIYGILVSILYNYSHIGNDYFEWYYIIFFYFILSIIYILCFCIFYNIFVKIVDYFKKNKLK